MLFGFAEMIVRLIVIFTLPNIIGQYGIYLSEVLPWPAAMIMVVVAYFVVYRNRCREFSDNKE